MSNHEEVFIEPWVSEKGWDKFDFNKVETPTYIINENILENNLKILHKVEEETGVKILMALKSFSVF